MAEEQFANHTEVSKGYSTTSWEGYRDSGFIPLDDLVYTLRKNRRKAAWSSLWQRQFPGK